MSELPPTLNRKLDAWETNGRRTVRWIIAAIIVIIGVVGWLWLQDQQEKDAFAEYVNAQRDQFTRCEGQPEGTPGCEKPVAPPVEDIDPDATIPPPPRPQVIRTVQMLSASDIRDALRRECGGPCKGKDGKVTDAQVRAAVAAHCVEGVCKGDPGEPGRDAPPVTDAQLAAAVQTYCTSDGDPCQSVPEPFCPNNYHAAVLEVMTTLTETTQIFTCVHNT